MPYSIDFSSMSAFEAMEQRISPVMGFLDSFWPKWPAWVQEEFSAQDFLAVETAYRRAGAAPTMHVLEWHEAAFDLVEPNIVPLLHGGETQAACLGHLAMRCDEHSLWPNRVVMAEAGRLDFYLDDEEFASIWPVEPAPKNSFPAARIESILLGLRKAEQPSEELAKRLKRWPGLGNIQALNADIEQTGLAHWPCPSEWLLSAKRLLARVGVEDATTADQQALVAAMFDAPSWHHLSALMKRKASALDWVNCGGPFLVEGDAGGKHENPVVFERMEDAFVALAARASKFEGGPVTVCQLGEMNQHVRLIAGGTGTPDCPSKAMAVLTSIPRVETTLDWETKAAAALTRGQAGVEALMAGLSAPAQTAAPKVVLTEAQFLEIANLVANASEDGNMAAHQAAAEAVGLTELVEQYEGYQATLKRQKGRVDMHLGTRVIGTNQALTIKSAALLSEDQLQRLYFTLYPN